MGTQEETLADEASQLLSSEEGSPRSPPRQEAEFATENQHSQRSSNDRAQAKLSVLVGEELQSAHHAGDIGLPDITDRQGENNDSPASTSSPAHHTRRRRQHAGQSNLDHPVILPRLRHGHSASSHNSPTSGRGLAGFLSSSQPGGDALPGESSALGQFADDLGDPVTTRILSLPNIVCRSAAGDLYMLGLDDIQHMLIKKRIGAEGMKILARHAQAQPEGELPKQTSAATAGRRKSQILSGQAEAASGGRTLLGAASARTSMMRDAHADELDLEVARHLALTEAKTEALRQHLAQLWAKRGNATPGPEEVELLKQQEALQAEAAELVVKLAPRRRNAVRHASNSVELADPSADPNQHLPDDAAAALAGRELGTDGLSSKSARWGKVHDVVEKVDKFPFMQEWDKATKKLRAGQHDQPVSGWDSLLVNNDIYVKGNKDLQGSTVYVLRCQELGVVPSTQVVQQLGCADSNMSHSKLGRRGAMALRHALAANNTITRLNLSNNSFDATAVGEIVQGLTSGSLAHSPVARKQLAARWQQLEFIKDKSADLSVNLQPRGLAQEKARMLRNHSPAPGSSPLSAIANRSSPSPDGGALASELSEPPTQSRSESRADDAGAAAGGAAHAMTEAEKRRRKAQLMKMPHVMGVFSNVTSLDLSSNPFGIYGARILADLLDPTVTQVQFLTSLNLNKCCIPETGGIALIRAIMNSNTVLQVLDLANNQLGNKTAEVLSEMLPNNYNLADLNLAWNKIGPDGMVMMCKGLELNESLTKLDLSWNGLENPGVCAVGLMLCRNKALQHLDLTSTRMLAEACLMLSEGIRQNKVLETLILNSNAVGDDGARHLMNALRSNDTLQFLGLQGANMTSAARGHNAGALFNPLAPDGAYSLDLHDMSERSVAVQLCQLDLASTHDLMRNIKCDGRNIPSCRLAGWPDSLPHNGQMSCDFVSKRQKREMKLMDDQKFLAIYSQMALSGSGSMSDREKLGLITVVAPFSYFTCKQIATMLSSFTVGEEQVEAAAVLLSRASDSPLNIDAFLEALRDNLLRGLKHTMSWYIYTRFDNCTGHYELCLSNPVHYSIAVRLKDVAYTENDFNNWNNMIYDKAATTLKFHGNYGPPEAWKSLIPTTGTLAFDYTSDTTAPSTASEISDTAFMQLLMQIGIPLGQEDEGTLDFEEANQQIAKLRAAVTGSLYFSCAQVIRMVGCFEFGPHRVEVCIILYARTIDLKNWWSVMYALRPLEQSLLCIRLGPANVLDRNHPSIHYVLDLANPAHEYVAKQLVGLGAQCPEMPNFWNLRLQGTKRYIAENRNMWGSFTSDTFSPLLEFDFAGPDSFDVLGRNRADIDALQPGDKLDLRTRLMKRNEMGRIKQMYAYFNDGSGWEGPSWQSKANLFKPQVEKPAWLASWDRLLRVLYRCDMRSGDIDSDSYLEDIFDEFSKGEGYLSQEEMDAMLKSWGYTKAEILHHYRKEFEAVAQPPEQDPDAAPVVDFNQYVPLMMTEPARRLRVVRDKDATQGLPDGDNLNFKSFRSPTNKPDRSPKKQLPAEGTGGPKRTVSNANEA